MRDHLIKPHGDELVDLIVSDTRSLQLKRESRDWISIDLSPRQISDLELLTNGRFSPLTGFMNKDDYESVCHDMHLSNGLIWPIPIVLDVSEEIAKKLKPGERLALLDDEGFMTVVLHRRPSEFLSGSCRRW